MPLRKLTSFLDDHDIQYAIIKHSRAYTAQQVAASAHISGYEVAKTVIVELDGDMAMIVVPASYQLDLDHVREVTEAREVKLASEEEFEDLFPGCEVGAMPPFGNLYDMEVYVAERLTEDEQIAFNAGTHTELLQMDYADFERLVQPAVADLGRVPA